MRGCSCRYPYRWYPRTKRIRSNSLKADRRLKARRRWQQKAGASSRQFPRPQSKFSFEPPWQATRLICSWTNSFTPVSTNGWSGRVLQLVPLERVPKLVVAEVECGGGGALVEAVTLQGLLEELALIFGDRGAEVFGGGRRCRGRDLR